MGTPYYEQRIRRLHRNEDTLHSRAQAVGINLQGSRLYHYPPKILSVAQSPDIMRSWP
jgi:hypothetical protein